MERRKKERQNDWMNEWIDKRSNKGKKEKKNSLVCQNIGDKK